MIISASRRTDIPAFYGKWFMNRIRAGFCTVPNPFNPNQVSTVSLRPEDVDAIVFWTRNPRPLLPHLPELDDRGYRYYFLYTLLANPGEIDPGSPPVEAGMETFRELSRRVGPQRVIWRYDPVFLTTITDHEFHLRAYLRIATGLRGRATRSVVSIAHIYRKLQGRMRQLARRQITLLPDDREALAGLMRSLAQAAAENDMEIRSCADETGLEQFGIKPGSCVDEDLIRSVFGIGFEGKKDPCQRKQCGCAASRDIGMYDSCLYGCVYCYATTSFERARANHGRHDPASTSLLQRPA